MAERRTEPGIIRIFRGYCGFILVYLLGFFIYTVLTTRSLYSPSFILFYFNLGVFALLFGYLSWVWLEKKMGVFYFPIAIAIAILAPMYSMTYFWPLQEIDVITNVIIRSWYLLPILIVPFTLVAWQYGYKVAGVLAVLLSFYDLPILIMRVDLLSLDMLQIISVPIIRAIALGTIGVIVGMLMDSQRNQRRKLMQANLQLSRYNQTLEQLATSRERNRLARELHDTLAHTLSSQILSLEAIRLNPPNKQKELDQILSQLITNSRKGLTETRRALKDLRAKPLEELGLEESLIVMMEDAAMRANIEIDLDFGDKLPDLPEDIEQSIYRVAQEGIENIVSHAAATKACLALKRNRDEIIFILEDNGKGFDPSQIDTGESHGIEGMKERIEECGGQFKVTSKLQKGTRITARFEVSHDPGFSM